MFVLFDRFKNGKCIESFKSPENIDLEHNKMQFICLCECASSQTSVQMVIFQFNLLKSAPRTQLMKMNGINGIAIK